MSDAGIWALQFDALPDDVGGLARVLQGLLIHEHMPDFYGVTLSDRQRGEPHVRGAEQVLERIAVHDPRPIATPPPGRRALRLLLPPLHADACRDAQEQGDRGTGALRLRRLLREGHVHRPLGDGVFRPGAAALGTGRFPDRRPAAREVRHRLRHTRRAARKIPGGGRCLEALPRRQGQPAGLRGARHVRPLVHRQQRDPRRGRPQQPRDAAVGRVGRHDPGRCRDRPRVHRPAGRVHARARQAPR